MSADNVFLACPLYDGRLDYGTARSLWSTASRLRMVNVMPSAASLLPTNCNALWCTALNHREGAQLKWFAMLHADVTPEPWWLDKLIAEAEAHDADLLSAVVPLKSLDGATSTAIARPGTQFGTFCRLTTQQVNHPLFPATFGIAEAAAALAILPEPLGIRDAPREALLVNTGCMVCRLDRPWCERVWFSIDDAIEKIDGLWKAVFQPEDWSFSRRVTAEGGKVLATKSLEVLHRGQMDFRSNQTWGRAVDFDGPR
jgi:hypothetical protein